MRFRQSLCAVFSALTRLYPGDFREQYAADLNSVFLDILEDSGGGLHAVWPLLREIAFLPVCLCREHLSVEGGGNTKSTRQVMLATLFGFLFFQFLMGIQAGTLIAFTDFHGADTPALSWFVLLSGGMLFGVFVGGAIGYVLSIKNIAAMMTACALAYMAPKFLSTSMLWGSSPPRYTRGGPHSSSTPPHRHTVFVMDSQLVCFGGDGKRASLSAWQAACCSPSGSGPIVPLCSPFTVWAWTGSSARISCPKNGGCSSIG
jgi:hypothetical protein